MAGIVQRIVSHRKFDFQFGAVQAAVTEVQIAPQIDISRWREIVFMVRTHALNVAGAWNTPPTLVFYADGFTTEDPTAGAALTQVAPQFLLALGANLPLALTAAPSYQLYALPTSPGSLVTVALRMAPGAAANNYTAWLSIDMSGKE